jgi:hypothetical protein
VQWGLPDNQDHWVLQGRLDHWDHRVREEPQANQVNRAKEDP